MEDAAAVLERGHAALAAGDWAAARDAFTRALGAGETPEALAGLGNALWWLGEMREATECYRRAYAGFRRRGAPAEAALAAISLSNLYLGNLGNRSVAAGWAARAARLSEPLGMPVLGAWVLLVRAGFAADPLEAAALAERAHRVALEAADRDLELCALSTRGAALLDAGRVEEGAALLDEALAAALGGEVENLDTVVFTSCELMRAYGRCAEFSRMVEWCRALDGFIERYGCPYVHATCRAQYGAVLVATGDWRRAESELQAAMALASDALPAIRAEAASSLAELRLAQGRVEEAARLLGGYEDQPAAAAVLAAVRLAQGDAALAAATARRRLEGPGGHHRTARLHEMLGEALLSDGDAAGAAREGRQVTELGAGPGGELITARGERLEGAALVAMGEPARARPLLERALTRFGGLGMPVEAGRARLALAEALWAENPGVAVAEARTALETFAALGAARLADAAAALLRRFGVPAARTGARELGALTRRELEVLGLVGEGLSNPEIASRLYISRRTVEHHVASVLSKLRLRNRAEMAAYAARVPHRATG